MVGTSRRESRLDSLSHDDQRQYYWQIIAPQTSIKTGQQQQQPHQKGGIVSNSDSDHVAMLPRRASQIMIRNNGRTFSDTAMRSKRTAVFNGTIVQVA